MDFFNIIITFLSNVEKKPYKFAKISPVLEPTTTFNDTFDIETGLYYQAHIINKYSITHHTLKEKYKFD